MSNAMLMPPRSIPANVTAAYLQAQHPDVRARRDRWLVEYNAARNFRDDAAKRSVLVKGSQEENPDYKVRVQLSRFCSYARKSLDRMIAASCEASPVRNGIDALIDWTKNADGAGGSLDTVTRKVLDLAAWHGLALALVDSRALEPGEPAPRSKLQEQTAGLLPYVAVFSPLNLYDLDSDSRGNLTFAKLATCQRTLDENGRDVERWRFDLITPERSAVYFVEPSGEVTQGPTVDRKPPFMPLIPCTGPKADAGIFGSCIVGDALELDLAAFSARSDRTFDAYVHAHPWVAISTLSPLGEVGIGSGKFIHLHPGDENRKPERAEYVQLDTGGLNALAALEHDAREDSLNLSGVNPLGAIQGGKATAASGVSISYTFEATERRTLLDLVAVAEVFEGRLLRAVAAHLGVTVEPDISWPRNWTMRDPAYFGAQLATIARFGLGGELWRAVSEQYAASLVNDAHPDRAAKIKAEIGATDGSGVFGQAMRGPDLEGGYSGKKGAV
jgi:hypothetical protein